MMLLGIAALLAIANNAGGTLPTQADAVSPLAAVFRVVQFPKHPRYELRVLAGPSVTIETYLEAQCLLDPRALDPRFGPPEDLQFSALFRRLRGDLDNFILKQVAPYLEPLDFDTAVNDRLNDFVRQRAEELGLLKLLQDGLVRDATRETGCLATMRSRITRQENERRAANPLTYDIIGLCVGTVGNVEDHLSFHARPSWSDAKAMGILSVLDTPGVRNCLASLLREDGRAGALAGNISPETTAFQYELALSQALDVWKRAGVEDVLGMFEEGRDLDARRAIRRLCAEKGTR